VLAGAASSFFAGVASYFLAGSAVFAYAVADLLLPLFSRLFITIAIIS
jgi:hypothetical protein